MTLRKEFITSAITVLVLILGCGLLYPLVIMDQPAASRATPTGRRSTSAASLSLELIGQNFALPVYKNGKPELSKGDRHDPDPRYFQTRPSHCAG